MLIVFLVWFGIEYADFWFDRRPCWRLQYRRSFPFTENNCETSLGCPRSLPKVFYKCLENSLNYLQKCNWSFRLRDGMQRITILSRDSFYTQNLYLDQRGWCLKCLPNILYIVKTVGAFCINMATRVTKVCRAYVVYRRATMRYSASFGHCEYVRQPGPARPCSLGLSTQRPHPWSPPEVRSSMEAGIGRSWGVYPRPECGTHITHDTHPSPTNRYASHWFGRSLLKRCWRFTPVLRCDGFISNFWEWGSQIRHKQLRRAALGTSWDCQSQYIPRSTRERFGINTIVGAEVYSRLGPQTVKLLPLLARESSRDVHDALRKGMGLGLLHRWAGLVGIAVQRPLLISWLLCFLFLPLPALLFSSPPDLSGRAWARNCLAFSCFPLPPPPFPCPPQYTLSRFAGRHFAAGSDGAVAKTKKNTLTSVSMSEVLSIIDKNCSMAIVSIIGKISMAIYKPNSLTMLYPIQW